ncbi:MAG: hypothetical protein Q8S92_15645 [Hydrogenophaga sp.]|uniref:hypothetical protein n=1 Tax=Hydrogenophaga sp. TaxID=1904254 RepID=UPI002733508A|nr:hypothetical protein [Hydrogenophaga sp.]MDP3350423.1 hypothetical protein [Hydrogenophaga sp.]
MTIDSSTLAQPSTKTPKNWYALTSPKVPAATRKIDANDIKVGFERHGAFEALEVKVELPEGS